MPIHRSHPTKNYTVLDNRVLRDKRLKGEEKGLLVWLLSKPAQWKIIIPVVMREMGWGRDKCYRILGHLMHLGYVTREQERGNSGAFGEVVYSVFAEPISQPKSELVLDAPLPDSPRPEKSKASKEVNKEISNIPPTPACDAERGSSNQGKPSFEEFWAAYKPDKCMSRHAAERKWNRMNDTDRRMAIEGVDRYLTDCQASRRKRVDAVWFLRDRIWEGYSTKKLRSLVSLSPHTPQWKAWRAYYMATEHLRLTAFMDAQARQGKHLTVPTEWPPNILKENVE